MFWTLWLQHLDSSGTEAFIPHSQELGCWQLPAEFLLIIALNQRKLLCPRVCFLRRGSPHLMTGPWRDTKHWLRGLTQFRTTVKDHHSSRAMLGLAEASFAIGSWFSLPSDHSYLLPSPSKLCFWESMLQYTSCMQISESQVRFWETGFKIHLISNADSGVMCRDINLVVITLSGSISSALRN